MLKEKQQTIQCKFTQMYFKYDQSYLKRHFYITCPLGSPQQNLVSGSNVDQI